MVVWFGSSAGVALSSQYPQAKSAVAWVRAGWHVTVAYVIAYFFMIAVLGWHPDVPHRALTTMPDGARAAATMLAANDRHPEPRFASAVP